jgi:hypothetical protein
MIPIVSFISFQKVGIISSWMKQLPYLSSLIR